MWTKTPPKSTIIQPDLGSPSSMIFFTLWARALSSIASRMAFNCGVDSPVHITKKEAIVDLLLISITLISFAFLSEAASTMISVSLRFSMIRFPFGAQVVKVRCSRYLRFFSLSIFRQCVQP